MRKLIIFLIILLLTVSACSSKPETEDQKTLYAIGADMAKNLSFLDLSAEEYKMVIQGMKDATAGSKLQAEPETYKQNINQLVRTKMQAFTQKQKELAKPFLENAAKGKDAQKTASGMIYQQIKEGTGVQPETPNIVMVNYTGTFIDGKEFFNTYKRGKPAVFPLGKTLPCITEGVSMMKIGGKSKIICPSDIAYGDQGMPPLIPGGATLVFEVELLDVKKDSSSVAPASVPDNEPSPKEKYKK